MSITITQNRLKIYKKKEEYLLPRLFTFPCPLGTSGNSFNFGFDRKFMQVNNNRTTKDVNAAKGLQIFPPCLWNRDNRLTEKRKNA